jgi:hypothetical protein
MLGFCWNITFNAIPLTITFTPQAKIFITNQFEITNSFKSFKTHLDNPLQNVQNRLLKVPAGDREAGNRKTSLGLYFYLLKLF